MNAKKLLLCLLLLGKFMTSTGQIHVSGSLCTSVGGVQTAGCSTSTLFFDMSTDPTIDGWRWDFGDGGFSTERNAQHNYLAAGKVTVRLQHFTKGTPAGVKTLEIEISDFPQPLLKGETNGKYDEKCAGPLKLDPFEGRSPPSGAKYKWFPDGQVTRTIEVENTGCYSVEVTNDKGCSKTVSINVEFCLAGPNQGASPQGWYFGDKAGISFTPVVSTTTDSCDINPNAFCDLLGQENAQTEGVDINPIVEGNELEAQDATAMVYNKSGALVLYASGTRIYDVNDELVAGGGSMAGSNNIPQSTVIVPRKICYECPSHQYYVLTVNAQTGVLYYSLVDIRGQRQVLEQNIPLATNLAGRITAIETQDGYRIFTHEAEGNTFRFFDVGAQGIVEASTSIGTSFTTAEIKNGVMKFSEQKTHFAVAFVQNGRNIVELFTFNPQNQGLSFVRRIDFGPAVGTARIYGVEFAPQQAPPENSPQGTQPLAPNYIYATIGTQVFRAGVRTPSVPQVIFTDPDGVRLGAMLIGPPQEGEPKSIVVARGGTSSVHAIDFPETNSPLFRPKASQTRGVMGMGLPEITRPQPESAGSGMVLKYRGRCAGAVTNFKVQPMCADKGKPIYNWDFGDGDKAITYAIPTVNHTYKNPGNYKLKLRIRIPGCGEREYEAPLVINPTPEATIPGLIPFCDLLTNGVVDVKIDPAPIGGSTFTYAWIRGLGTNLGTTPTIIAMAIDKYAVRIKNEKLCETTKTFEVKQICQPEIYVPEIFTPNLTDLKNDRFRFFPYYVSNLKVRVYNRWGERVFSAEQKASDGPIIGFDQSNIDTISDLFWDGRFNNEDAPPGTYAYEIEYVEAFTITKRIKTQKGSVLLVR